MKKDYMLDRLEKALYMGFLLDANSNEFLGKNFYLNFKRMEEYISNYNKSISKKGYPIELTFDYERLDLQIRTLWEFVYLNEKELNAFIVKLEKKIHENLAHSVKSYTDKGIEIYDLELLVELNRTGITTMGDTYMAFNNKKYLIHFAHLQQIIG